MIDHNIVMMMASSGRATILVECLNAMSVCLCQYIYVMVCGCVWVCVNVSLLANSYALDLLTVRPHFRALIDMLVQNTF